MKYTKAIAILGLLTALQGAGVTLCAQQGSDANKEAPAGAPSPSPSLRPCTLARSILKQQGLLDSRMTMLPSADSFAAANGGLKLVLACGLSSDETYTFSRLLARSGTGLLVFKRDEAPEQVFELLADRLGITYHLANPEAPGNVPRTYVFPPQGNGDREVRITLDAPGLGSHSPSPRGSGNRGAWATSGGLQDFYLLAKANDPDLGRSQSRVAASLADTDIARAAFHPRVDASFGMSQIDQTVLNYTPTSTHSSVFGYNYDVTARLPLLHMPTAHNLSSARAAMRGEESGATAAKQNLIVRLADAYFAILRAKTDQQIARDELERVKQILDQAQAFLKAGTGDIIAVYEAKARLDGVIADLSRAESTLRLAEQKFSGIVGKPVTVVAEVLHLQPMDPEPDDLEWWLTTLEKQDPQVRQAREGLAQTVEQTKAAQAERYPVLDASAGYDVSKGSAFLPEVETREWHVGATVSVSLYSGGETAARIRRAVANQDERRYMLEATLEQRRENLKQSFFNLRYNVSLIKALKQKEISTEIQLNGVRKGRSLGTRTAIDLLNAEQAYSIAKRDLRNALYDNVVRIIQLKAAAGILEEADLSGA